MKIKFVFTLFVAIAMTMPIMAQNALPTDTIFTNESKNVFIDNFKKNIAIDKENYNISIDYNDSENETIIFSGKAKNVGSLTANFRDALIGEIYFKIQLKYHQESGNFMLTPQRIVFTYNPGPRTDFSYMPTSILQELHDEFNTVITLGPDFEINKHFMSSLEDYKYQMEDKLAESEDTTLKKKERKKAKKEYDEYAIKYKVYQDVYSEVKHCITKLKLYYFYN